MLENEWAVESQKERESRLFKYTIFKGLKQKAVWKNILRSFVTSFQVLAFAVLLNVKYGKFHKLVLTGSAIMSWGGALVIIVFIWLIGYNLYIINTGTWETDKKKE